MHWRDYLEAPELGEFTARVDGRLRLLVRYGYEDDAELLSGRVTCDDVEWIGGGRAAHPLITLPRGERVVVRRYCRGGFIRHLNRARYFVGHRAFDELRATERAGGGGATVPAIVAAAEVRGPVGYTAALATRWIAGTAAVPTLLRSDPSRRASILRLIGQEIEKIHRAGVAHPDLNLRNFLLEPGTLHLTVLDFDRARLYAGETPADVRRRNLRRLGRSARKLGVGLTAADWVAMRDGYGAGWPLMDPRG